ncbi:hypothetical protein UUU_37630 [Klebsiella pneumoniae subsp. pneumoniae DSM 30104 = JCM 1662 = NBRC 14940]|nr:hypothetical protein UUU_37630 [Klebsiella pneumoniae subsp. pneumoniae DSM 30104 = JCM 1662 = NBRC 14940]
MAIIIICINFRYIYLPFTKAIDDDKNQSRQVPAACPQ